MSDKLHQFLPIWAIPDFLKCPVAGAMLTVEKHRSILKKCSYDVKSMKPYEYHQKIMLKLAEKSRALKEMSKARKTDAAAIRHLEARNRELTARVQTLQPDPAARARNNAEKIRFGEKIQAPAA